MSHELCLPPCHFVIDLFPGYIFKVHVFFSRKPIEMYSDVPKSSQAAEIGARMKLSINVVPFRVLISR